MKYIFLILMTLSFVSCASHRGPASTPTEDVKETGLTTDYYGTR